MPLLTPEERIGRTIAGKYRITRLLGKGGMGVVFAGVHAWTHRQVAIKVLASELATTEGITERFLREARAAAMISHPNAVEVLDMGADTESDGSIYLVLEFLRGESLNARLERCRTLSKEETAAVLLPVMDVLRIAHGKGIVHRDIKPDNIFLSYNEETDETRPKLLDFGIAKVREAEGRVGLATQSGMTMGTPAYMSPEQVRDASRVGPPADIWSMGVVWYECLSGFLPFRGNTANELLIAIATTAAIPLRTVAPSLPPQLAATIDRALHPNAGRRFTSIVEFADALAEAYESAGIALPRLRRDNAVETAAISISDTISAVHKINAPAFDTDEFTEEPTTPVQVVPTTAPQPFTPRVGQAVSAAMPMVGATETLSPTIRRSNPRRSRVLVGVGAVSLILAGTVLGVSSQIRHSSPQTSESAARSTRTVEIEAPSPRPRHLEATAPINPTNAPDAGRITLANTASRAIVPSAETGTRLRPAAARMTHTGPITAPSATSGTAAQRPTPSPPGAGGPPATAAGIARIRAVEEF